MEIDVELTPGSVPVRGPCDLEFTVRADGALDAGDTVAWQLPFSWTALRNGPTYTKRFQTRDPAGAHYVAAAAPDATFEVDIERRHHPDDTVTRHGRRFVATLVSGRVPAGTPIRLRCANTNAAYVAGEEQVLIRVAGEKPDSLPALAATPGDAERLRVVAPSVVRPGERFPVLVVSLDRYENRSASSHEADLRLEDGTVVVRDLSFEGAVRVPVGLDGEGIRRFAFADAVSNPVRVSEDAPRVYWGDIHAHSGLSHDGMGQDPYGYARDVSGLDFAAVTDRAESMAEAGFGQVLDRAEQYNDPDQFVTLPAYEVALPEEYGAAHCNFYFRTVEAFDDQRARDDVATVVEEPDDDAPGPEEMLFFSHHTGISGFPFDPDDLATTEQTPAVEIYSHHGQSEYYAPQHALSYEFNRVRKPERRVNNSVRGHFVQDFWERGYRFGAIGSSDTHTGQPGKRFNGTAAVVADELTRDAIFEGIRGRDCYGTTGERILLDFSVGATPMGGVRSVDAGETVTVDLEVHGTDILTNVEVLRHRFGADDGFVPVLADAPDANPPVKADDAGATTPNAGQVQRAETMDARYEFEETVEDDCLYYARITQAPLDRPAMAWSSPVWIEVA